MMKVENNLDAYEDVEIQGITIDSRKINKGNLFIPFIGEQVDGHQYVEAAFEKGASAVLWQKDVPNPPQNLPIVIVENTLEALQQLARSYRSDLDVKVVGITGSNGKTTTKDMIASLLSLSYRVQKTEGNYNNHIGLPLTILSLDKDTEVAVLEMGMSSIGEIEFLTKLASPDAVVITNIGESHLQDLGSRDRIADAKFEIVEGLSTGGLLVFHGDEPLLWERVKQYKGDMKIQTFGRSDSNTLYPLELSQTNDGSIFKVNVQEGDYKLPVLGAHNVLNALASMLIARHFGIAFEEMNNGFASLKVTNMRMELLEGSKGEKIINDAYNASPTSMRAAIELVTTLSGYKKKVLVLGDMRELGRDEHDFHFKVGNEIDSNKIDFVFTYGELGESIAKGAKEVFPESRVFSYQEKDRLLADLQNIINDETLVLVKGSRSMRLEEIVHGLL